MNLWFDLKYSWRLLRKSWGYSLMCAIVVALSVGLALWTYSLAYSQALKPLGYPGSERWYSVQLAAGAGADARPVVDAYTFQQIRDQTDGLLGAFASRSAVLSEGEASVRLRAAAISPALLSATGVVPEIGRVLNAADSEPGAAPAVVISHDTWQSYFAGDPNVVGSNTRVDAQLVRVVGVLPRDFLAFEDFEVFVPLQMPILAAPSESDSMFAPFVVIDSDAQVQPLQQRLDAAVQRVNANYPERFSADRRLELIPAHLMYSHSRMQVVTTLSLLALAVLVLGGVNVSMVFLARLLERSRELALRAALGASRGRLIRQCLVETALIVILGLIAGCGLAALGVQWAADLTLSGAEIEGTGRPTSLLTLRPVDLGVAVAAAVLIWLLSTLVPARRISRQDAAQVLAGTGKGAAVRGNGKMAGVLVGLQVIVSCVVLVICGNLVLAVNQEASRPSGVNVGDIMLSTYPTVLGDRYESPSERERYFEDLAAAVRSRIPDAQVAFASAVPTRPPATPVEIDTREGGAYEGALELPVATVSEDYFDLLGIQLRSGRLFDTTDTAETLPVAVIDEATAERYWPGTDAIGKQIRLAPSESGPQLTIVGVVSHTRRPYDDDVGVVYQSFRQALPASFLLMASLPGDSAAPRSELRAAAFAVDRDLPLHNLQMLGEFLDAKNMIVTTLVPVFIAVGVITSVLAATGLFGLISRSVAQRTQEVGIRRALGATPWKSISVFMRQGTVYMAVGLFGIVVGVILTNLMGASFSNILDHVLVVTLCVLLLTCAVIFSASYLPTRRAVALEPGDALRYE